MAGLLGLKPAFPLNLGLAPSKTRGPACISQTLDFTSTSSYSFDLTTAAVQAGLSTLQSVFADNSLNPFKVTLFFPATNQTLVIPPRSGATFPILGKITGTVYAKSGDQTKFANLGGICNLFFMNVPVPFSTWDTSEKGLICNQSQVSVIGGASWTKILNANPNRKAFILLSQAANMSIQLGDVSSGQIQSILLGANASFSWLTQPCYQGAIYADIGVTNFVNIFEYVDSTTPATNTQSGNPGP